MKKLVLLALLSLPLIQFANASGSHQVFLKKMEEKKVKVTIKVNGYTLTLQGDLQIHIFQGTVTFEGTLTIQGNGLNLTLPIYYHGSGNDRVNLAEMTEEAILEFIIMEEIQRIGLLD
jgi:hypothetical protein